MTGECVAVFGHIPLRDVPPEWREPGAILRGNDGCFLVLRPQILVVTGVFVRSLKVAARLAKKRDLPGRHLPVCPLEKP